MAAKSIPLVSAKATQKARGTAAAIKGRPSAGSTNSVHVGSSGPVRQALSNNAARQDAKQAAQGAKEVAGAKGHGGGKPPGGGKGGGKPPGGGGSPAVQPFLTPAQQAQFNAAAFKYMNSVAGVNQDITARGSNYHLGQSTLDRNHVVGTDNANQNLAARGLFQSSIRAGDLNDLDATYAMHSNILRTNFNTAFVRDLNQLGLLGTDWTTTYNGFNQLEIQNAQNVTPNVPASGQGQGGGGMNPGQGAASGVARADAQATQQGHNMLIPPNPFSVDAQQAANGNKMLNPASADGAQSGSATGATPPGYGHTGSAPHAIAAGAAAGAAAASVLGGMS